MKKLILILLIITSFSVSAYAQKYKVTAGGKVTSKDGNIQNSVQSNNLINNYYGNQYVDTQQAAANNVQTFDIVMDYSGSMDYWINSAKRFMAQIIAQLPSNYKIGFRVFGYNNGHNPYNPIVGVAKEVVKNNKGKYKVKTDVASYMGSTNLTCSSTKSMVAVSAKNTALLQNKMNEVEIGGATPLTLALYNAVNQDFAGLEKNYKKKIILITDGFETCGGDPCEYVKRLVKERNDIIIDVVLVSALSYKIECLANATNGKVYTPADVNSFMNVIKDSFTTTASPEDNQEEQQYEQHYEYIKD